ncbi:MAG: hypothetical protein K8L91_02100 [Anaerolineae bacterium]|nr:hypothetical protein [Anaerolineae bacterium]
MTALDTCEPQIIRALEKDGWRIVVKPYSIYVDERSVLADFGAQYVTDTEVRTIVVVEVKCFSNAKADLTNLYTAVGQYQYYRVNLKRDKPDVLLFLAIPDEAYQRFLLQPSFLDTFAETGVKLLIVDTEDEEIVQWLTW